MDRNSDFASTDKVTGVAGVSGILVTLTSVATNLNYTRSTALQVPEILFAVIYKQVFSY